MKLNRYTYLLLLLVFCMFGCVDHLEQVDNTQTGTIVLNVSGEAMSKAISSYVLPDPDDRQIWTLNVWLVQGGTVVDLHTSSPKAPSAEVVFENVKRGDYKLYIVANYDGGLADKYPVDSGLANNLAEEVLGDVDDGQSPTYASANGVPASLEMDISVAPGDNKISAHLKRTVGRLTVIFRNLTEHDLYLGDMSLSSFNPSKGYLFGQNHTLPGNAVYCAFPALDGDPVKIGAETTVFDHYLYETGYPSSSFELFFDAGLYKLRTSPTYKDTEVTTTTVTLGANKTTLSTGEMFMIHSYASPKFYVGADDSGLVCTEFGSDANIVNSSVVDNYLWTWETGSSIKNVATGKYMTVSTSPGVSDTPETMYVSDEGDYFTIRNNNDYYYLALNATNTGLTYYTLYSWYLRDVTRTTATETKKAFTGDNDTFLTRMEKNHSHEMKYIDKYGVAQPLTHICRNEHIVLTVNISYQQSTGGFDVSVASWANKDNETTFD